ncbi:MAG: HAD-IIB family hydrolase [Clostridia bacterium]|nr:HAD-IIB family hydrolase [Clostridia bacterium]
MKIIASDYDGTLSYNGKISDEDKLAIKRFREAGNKFGIVTGRDVELASWIRPKDGLELDFVICCTGAVIKDENGKIIYKKSGEVGEFFNEIIKKAISLNADCFAISDILYKCYIDVSENIPTDLSRMSEFTHANCGFSSEQKAIEFVDYVNANFSDKISIHRNGRNVDMPPMGISKVTGIYEYAKSFKNAEIYTVGDNMNDLSMLLEFDGYAVSNANEKVIELAKHRCNRICDMIEELLKGE